MVQVAGDQRPSKQELAEEHDQKTPGNARAHAALRAKLTFIDQANDAKDERSIANRLDKAKPQNDDGDNDDKPLPTEIARSVRELSRCCADRSAWQRALQGRKDRCVSMSAPSDLTLCRRYAAQPGDLV